ncbi:hypothetical protein PAECIP111893_03381 [Paenibacillus plantiphilus]|uniref:HemX protein n=1 Tax=Paenibacillus plantiphilus TaxID=2905650 RepID=A0ABM9CFC3_9BACL|nr:hypothetical protein [Paenibacillus plantiphilus]CAH1211367.1 hypothetical protein PAECIP111893_03381 [Paenibacillus plantiphilus]
MNTSFETESQSNYNTRRRKSRATLPLFLSIWMLLIASGVVGAIWYTDQIKKNLTAAISNQTAKQITDMQTKYEARLKGMETSFSNEITKVQGKVDALNQLLEFSKDNASSKTDNSNKLYTQLNDVKKQLAQLKKDLDVLK